MRPSADFTKYGYQKYLNGKEEWFRPNDGTIPEHDLLLTYVSDGRTGRPLQILHIDGIPMCITYYDPMKRHYETTWMGFLIGAVDIWDLKNAWLWTVMEEWMPATFKAYEAFRGHQHIKTWISEGNVPDGSWSHDVIPTAEEKTKLEEILGDRYPYFPQDDGHALCEFEGTLASYLYEHAPDMFPKEPTGW